MNDRQKFKYGILIILLSVTLIQNIHFADFCEGMASGLLFAFCYLLFLIFFIIIELRDLFKLIRHREKFDFIPLLIFSFFILSNCFLLIASENRFWRKINYEGEIDNVDSNGRIVLFENNTFEITESQIEERCIYSGDYLLVNNILILNDENIESKTDNDFTRKYYFISDSILQPFDKKFHRIKIKFN